MRSTEQYLLWAVGWDMEILSSHWNFYLNGLPYSEIVPRQQKCETAVGVIAWLRWNNYDSILYKAHFRGIKLKNVFFFTVDITSPGRWQLNQNFSQHSKHSLLALFILNGLHWVQRTFLFTYTFSCWIQSIHYPFPFPLTLLEFILLFPAWAEKAKGKVADWFHSGKSLSSCLMTSLQKWNRQGRSNVFKTIWSRRRKVVGVSGGGEPWEVDGLYSSIPMLCRACCRLQTEN